MSKLFSAIHWRRPVLAAIVALAALAGCVNLDSQQRKWIFQASSLQGTAGAAIDGMDEVWIDYRPAAADDAASVRLHALWADAAAPDAPLLLYLHGARRDVRSSTWRIRQMRALGFAVLAIDYRGFGRSTDELPSEATVAEDARAAWDWLAAQHPGRARYIFGHSLGGAIAVRLAADVAESAKGLIVEGTFTSIPAVFETLRFGWLPLAPLITQRFDSADRIASVRTPVLVVHGTNDTLIRPELGRALYELATAPKRFVLVDGGTHYSTNGRGQAQYRDALRELFGIGS